MDKKIKWPRRYSRPTVYAVKMCPEQAVLSCCSQTPGTVGAKMSDATCYGVDTGGFTLCGYTNGAIANHSDTPS